MALLPWLLPAPENFNGRCAALQEDLNWLEKALALASCELSVNQCNRLNRSLQKIDGASELLSEELTPFRLGIVSNATFDLVVPALVATAMRYGVHLEVILADFDQVAQEAFNPESTVNCAKPDAVLLALDYRAFPFGKDAFAGTPGGLNHESALEYLQQLCEGFRLHSGAQCIVQSLAVPPTQLLGSLDRGQPGTLQYEITAFNNHLVEWLEHGSELLLDVAALAARHGTYQWFDERQWYMSRIAMANELIPVYAEHLVRLPAALRGKSHKCLVLDLDNTLWGGVIGDDGLDGIQIGQGHPRSEAHLTLQRYALELKSMGVILAVCSKNEEHIARQAFSDHPDMLLKEEDFAIFVANWEDKASNIRRIAKALNIGLDSLVFVDDNPVERDIVRTLVPEVSVPEVPSDPALVPRTLSEAGYFELVSFTREDAERSAQYAANAQREQALEATGDIGDFLQSLNMKIEFQPFNAIGRKRITQLVNKTNQFNLTTRRYTEAEIHAFEESGAHYTLQVRHSDKFGDNGMISVVICAMNGATWDIDSWLMSCRVIKRRTEEAVCDELVRAARQAGARRLRGYYSPTPKNALVKNHYEMLGFSHTGHDGEYDIWELELADYKELKPPVTILGKELQAMG